MNELLQKHGCSNVFSLPEGLKELMSDISREVLREQPAALYEFIANYLSALLVTREHGILAARILDDLCDCRPSVTEHLYWLGIGAEDVKLMAEIIKKGIEGKAMYEEEAKARSEEERTVTSEETEAEEGYETVREMEIIKFIIEKVELDEASCAKVCQVIRNAYRDYWYRKKLLETELKLEPETPWEVAAEHTLDLYKRTKPSLAELNRASERIQAAYKGYHVRKNILAHLKKPKDIGPKRELPGPPLDIADSREIDLGDVIKLQVKDDNVSDMFKVKAVKDLGLRYDPMKAITHDDSVKKNVVKIQSKTDSSITLYEDSSNTLETARETVKKLLFPPKTSNEQFQMPKDVFLSLVPGSTKPSDHKLVVVVLPRKNDSVCTCEGDLNYGNLTESQTNAIAAIEASHLEKQHFAETETSETVKSESEALRCLRQTASVTKSKKVSIAAFPIISGKRLEPKGSVTPRSSPTDTSVFTEEQSIKGPEDANDVKLAPNSQANVAELLSLAKVPSDAIIATETNVNFEDEDKRVLDQTVVGQTMATRFRPPLLSPLIPTMPAIPEVDEKSSTSSLTPSDPSGSLESGSVSSDTSDE